MELRCGHLKFGPLGHPFGQRVLTRRALTCGDNEHAALSFHASHRHTCIGRRRLVHGCCVRHSRAGCAETICAATSNHKSGTRAETRRRSNSDHDSHHEFDARAETNRRHNADDDAHHDSGTSAETDGGYNARRRPNACAPGAQTIG